MKHYVCKIATKPTTVTAGTVYQAFVNTDETSLRITKMHIQLDSADAGGNGNSVYAFARIKGTPTSGTTLTVTKYDNQNEPSKMLCLRNQAGLDMTGVTQEPYFLERSVISKSTGSASTIEFDNNGEGFILAKNEGLIIFADNAVVSGSGIYGMIEWMED
jgi:hypothetical protein